METAVGFSWLATILALLVLGLNWSDPERKQREASEKHLLAPNSNSTEISVAERTEEQKCSCCSK
jgi:hypothetical protein